MNWTDPDAMRRFLLGPNIHVGTSHHYCAACRFLDDNKRGGEGHPSLSEVAPKRRARIEHAMKCYIESRADGGCESAQLLMEVMFT